MRRESMIPRRRLVMAPMMTMAVGLGLGAVLASGYSAQGCGPDAHRSSLVWDGSAYAVSWAAPENGAVTVYAHRFLERDFDRGFEGRGFEGRGFEGRVSARDSRLSMSIHAKSRPAQVLRVKSALSPPEIVHGGDGFLVVVHKDDHSLVAVPLDRGGKVSGEGKSITRGVQALCVTPVSVGELFIVAYVTRRDGDRPPGLFLAHLDETGNVIETRAIGGSAGRCAMASDGRRVVLVQEASRQGDGAAHLTGHVLGDDHAAASPVEPMMEIGTSGRRSGPLRVVRHEPGWALLHAVDDSGTLRIEIIDDRGRHRESHTLPENVDAASVDLGSNASGPFVTWLAKRRVHILTLGDGEEYVSEARHPDVAGTRAVGHDTYGATSWTSLGGAYVHVLRWQ